MNNRSSDSEFSSSRKGFSVDRKAFEAGVCREFARARRRGNDSYPFVLWDANIRVACDVEPGNPLHRDGEPMNIIYRRLLGVEAKMASVAVWHEWASRPSQLV